MRSWIKQKAFASPRKKYNLKQNLARVHYFSEEMYALLWGANYKTKTGQTYEIKKN